MKLKLRRRRPLVCTQCYGAGRTRDLYRWHTCSRCAGTGRRALVDLPRAARPAWMRP